VYEAGLGRAAHRVAVWWRRWHQAGGAEGCCEFRGGVGPRTLTGVVKAGPWKAVRFTGSCEIGACLHTEGSEATAADSSAWREDPTIGAGGADFNSSVENVVNAAFFSTGEVHRDQSRIVEDWIYDRFVDARMEAPSACRFCGRYAGGDRHWAVLDKGADGDGAPLYRDRAQGMRLTEVRGRRLTEGTLANGWFRRTDGILGRHARAHDRAREIFGLGAGDYAGRRFLRTDGIANGIPFGAILVHPDHESLAAVRVISIGLKRGLVDRDLPSAGVEYQFLSAARRNRVSGRREQGPAAFEFYSDYKTIYSILIMRSDRFSIEAPSAPRFCRNGKARPMTGRTTLDILRDPGLTRSSGPAARRVGARPAYRSISGSCGAVVHVRTAAASFRDAEHGTP